MSIHSVQKYTVVAYGDCGLQLIKYQIRSVVVIFVIDRTEQLVLLERKWGIVYINISYHFARAFGNKGCYSCTYRYYINKINFSVCFFDYYMSFYFSVKDSPVKPATRAWDFVNLITFSFSHNHFVI